MRRVCEDDEELSVAEAFIKEMKTASIDTGIEFHFMRFMMRVDIQTGHDELIALIRYRLGCWPNNLPQHHKKMAEELMRTVERKKLAVEAKRADNSFVAALRHDGEGRFQK
ncbi:MAG: hypothetical protein ABL899_00675 [Nitrospira sp.]